MSRDPHELECARAAYAALVEKAKTAAEKRELRKALREFETSCESLVLRAIGAGDSNIDYIKSQMPIKITDKEIYNALGSLTRKKMVRRMGYKLYRNINK
jgi:DNA-binding HxlR family transcriptional regulator